MTVREMKRTLCAVESARPIMVPAIHKLPDHALCAGCNYPLRGLTEYRCPECGREFDPHNLDSINLGPALGAAARRLMQPIGWEWIAAITILMLPMLWWAAQPLQRASDDRVMRALTVAAAGVVLLWVHHAIRQFTLRRCRQPDRDRERHMRRRTQVIAVILLVAIGVFFNLPLRAGFFVSLPWFNRMAARVRSNDPTVPPPPNEAWLGIYQIDFTLSHRRPNGDMVLVLRRDQNAAFVLTHSGGEPDDFGDEHVGGTPLVGQHGHLLGAWYWQN